MKKFLTLLIILCVSAGLMSAQDANLRKVSSPDGNVELSFNLKDGHIPVYSLDYKGKPVVGESHLGFKLQGSGMYDWFEISETATREIDETWNPVWGEEAQIRNHCNEMTVTLRQTSSNRFMKICFRVFDDGMGLRYEFPDQKSMAYFVITDELTEFAMTGDHTAWWIPGDYDTQEYDYTRSRLSEIRGLLSSAICDNLSQTIFSETGVQTSLQMKTDDGIYINLHEAALVNYPAMHLLLDDKNMVFKAHLTPDPNGDLAYMQSPCTTPWRTVIVSDDARDILASRITLNLNEPCKIEDTSWIKPGKYIGIWWILHKYLYTWYYDAENPQEHGATTERTKRYIDFAAENDIQGVLVEGWNVGWNGDWMRNSENFSFTEAYPDYDFDEVMSYARSKGVQMVIHNETAANTEHYFSQIDEAYAKYRDAGMHYVKTGNVNLLMDGKEEHDSQYGVNKLHEIVEKAAEYQICIDEHEPCIPTGLCRTWPNLMTGEAIRGQEHDAWERDGGNKPEHQTVCPFIRGLAGPMDYTFGTFDFSNPNSPFSRVRTTIAKQLAQYVVIYSPLQMASDDPSAYEGVKAFDFIRDVPTDWEQTKVVDAVIGDYIISDWYLGAITDENARDLQVPLSFLGKGEWLAQVYADAPDASYEDNPTAVAYSEMEVTAASTLDLHLATSGGCAIRFIPKSR